MPLSDIFLLSVYLVLMLVLALFASHAYLMVALYRRRKHRTPLLDAPAVWPVVTVQLPIYNELYVVRRLIESVCALDYPKDRLEIQVLDDSTDDTRLIVTELVDEFGLAGIDIKQINRSDRSGFKAGALRAGLEVARGEFIAIFDADFVPSPDFLRRTLPPLLRDSGIAFAQARWGHLNRTCSILTEVVAVGLDAHFVIEHGARNAHGLFINFNGTAGVWRKAALIDAGNWDMDTLAEDIDIAYRAQLRGWRTVYLNDVVCDAELPAEVHGLKIQQYRWAKGTIQTAKKLLPAVWGNRTLSLLTKWEATTALTIHLVFPVMLLLFTLVWPVLHVKVNQESTRMYFAAMSVFIVFAGSYPLLYAYGQKEIAGRWQWRLLFLVPLFLAYSVGMSVVNTRAVLSALANRQSPFLRTPKFMLDDRTRGWGGKMYRGTIDATGLVELALAAYFAAAIWYAIVLWEFGFVPLLLLPFVGFAWIGGLSALQGFGSTGRRVDPGRDQVGPLEDKRVVGLARPSQTAHLSRGWPLVSLAALIAVLPSTALAQTAIDLSSEHRRLTVLPSCATEKILVVACFDFETGMHDRWRIAERAAESFGYVRGTVDLALDIEQSSGRSLRLQAEFDSVGWSAIALELLTELSLMEYAGLVARVRAPADPALRLSVRFAMVAGPLWDWLETEESVPLEPGEWSVVAAPLEADAWRAHGFVDLEDEREWVGYLGEVHAIVIRVEANPDRSRPGSTQLVSLYIDDIRFPLRGGR